MRPRVKAIRRKAAEKRIREGRRVGTPVPVEGRRRTKRRETGL